jgi:hypothetical protein
VNSCPADLKDLQGIFFQGKASWRFTEKFWQGYITETIIAEYNFFTLKTCFA